MLYAMVQLCGFATGAHGHQQRLEVLRRRVILPGMGCA
ncbi:MAG: alpha-glucosidase MalZ, partial [Halomonas sp. HL-93]